jgi:hypothetical protein
MPKFVESDHVRAEIGTFAEQTHTPPENQLPAGSRIPPIGDWAEHVEAWDVGNVRPGGPNAAVEYVVFHAGPYTGQIMPTDADGEPLADGSAPSPKYVEARDELVRSAAEAAIAAQPAEALAPADYLRRLVDAGMEENVARTTTCASMTLNMSKSVNEAGREALDAGREVTAALLVMAHSSISQLPRKLLDAGADIDAAEAAFVAAKSSLRSTSVMFDMMRGGGREPVFVQVEAMLDEAREVLSVKI